MKKVKRTVLIALILMLAFSVIGCGKKDDGKDMVSKESHTATTTYKDGEYEAAGAKYDDQGYRDTVKIVIKDGKLFSVSCDADSKNDGTKKAHSESGQYNMKAGGSQYEWHEEIAYFENYVVQNGIESVQLKNDGRTDSVTGCTIVVKKYVDLIKDALNKAKEK